MTDQNQAPAGAAQPTVPAAAPKKSRRWITPVLGIVAALVIGLFGGILIGHATAPAPQAGGRAGFSGNFQGGTGQRGAGGGTGFGGGAGTAGPGGGFAGGGFAAGTIVSVSGGTIVLKETSGTQATVTTTSTTTVTKTAKSTVSALKAGETITVVGQADSSGNITATSVSEGAAASRFGGRGGNQTPSPGANG